MSRSHTLLAARACAQNQQQQQQQQQQRCRTKPAQSQVATSQQQAGLTARLTIGKETRKPGVRF
jgi:hypothetical protein